MKNSKLGKYMKQALEFLQKWFQPGEWASYNARDRSTVEPIKRLAKRGLVETNEYNQFRMAVR